MKVVAVVGPTGVGKSSLGVHLAHLHRGEVISADSRQIYKGLEIGAEAITLADMEGIPHHLVGTVPIDTAYSAADFKQDGARLINEIVNRGNVPFVVGGTGFYTSALLEGLVLPEVPANQSLRSHLDTLSTEALAQQLRTVDERRWSTVDTKNRRRLIRALEIAEALGVTPVNSLDSAYNVVWIGIMPPENLQTLLRERAQKQIDAGLLKETEQLMAIVSAERLVECGFEYQAARDVLQGNLQVTDLPDVLAQRNLAYAKRQMTYFKKNPKIVWIERNEVEKAESLVREHLRGL